MKDIIIYVLGIILALAGGIGMIYEGLHEGRPMTAWIGGVMILGVMAEVKDTILGTTEEA